MSVEMSYEDLPDGVVRVILEIDAQLLLDVHEDVARILVRDLLRNALLQRQRLERPAVIRAFGGARGGGKMAAAAQDQQTRENRVRYYEELRRIMSEPNPILFDGLTFAERRNPGYRYDVNNPFEPWPHGESAFPSSTPARGCDSHIFTDPACAACTAIQAKYPKKRKLNPTHPLNALDGERE